MNEVIITPLLLTLNMRTTKEHGESVNINMKCHRTGQVFDTYQELKKFRMERFPEFYIEGVPFFMLEVNLNLGQRYLLERTELLEGLENDPNDIV